MYNINTERKKTINSTYLVSVRRSEAGRRKRAQDSRLWVSCPFPSASLLIFIRSVVLLPALKPVCSSALIFSTWGFSLFSMIFSVTGWWGWSFGSSGSAASCLSWEVWWLRTGSRGWPFSCLQILLQIVMRVVITTSPPAWTSSAGMLLTAANFPFFTNYAAASTSLWRMGWLSSVSVLGQFSTNGSPLALWLYSSLQYSVHQFSISRSPLRHLPEWSWTVVDFPCFTMVKSITSWYALLLLFFPRFPAISWHCFSTQFSFAFFMHLVLLFSSLYFSDPFFLSSVLLSHRSRISAVTQDLLFLCSLPRIWLAVTVNCCDWLNSTYSVQH